MTKFKHFIFLVFILFSGYEIFGQVNLVDGLVFHLPLDNNFNDVSGNNINGANQNTLVAQNRFGSKMKAVKFDGAVSNGIVSMGAPLMNNLTNWSISYWFRIDQNFNGMSLVGQDNSIETGYYTNSNRVIVFHPTFGSFSFPVSNPSSWNHVIITGNSSEVKCYLNGNLVRSESGNFTAVSTSHNFNIGGNVVNQSNNSWLRGAVDDVRLYNRVLNANEVNALFDINSVQINVLNISNLNPCAGDSIVVEFQSSGNILEGNEYLLELSDFNGNFNDNIQIGKIMSDSSQGSIVGVIPVGIPSGLNYVLRVSSTNVMSAGNSSQNINIRGVVGDIPDPNLFKFVGEANGRLYYRSTSDADYTTAKNNCLANGGHLANIGNQEDQNLLYSYIISLSAWIGLNDDENSGSLTWQNDFSTTYTLWQPSQPGSASNIVMRVDNGRWNGLASNQSRDYFLQLEPAGLNLAKCEGSEVILSPGNINNASYLWSGPNNFSSNIKNPVIENLSQINQGNYVLEASSNGCVSSGWSFELNVENLPTNKVIGLVNNSICEGSTAEIFVLATEVNHEYSLIDGFSLTTIGNSKQGNGDTLFFTSNILSNSTQFLIKISDPITSCELIIQDTLSVGVLSLPSSPSVQNEQICNGGRLDLNASGAIAGEVYNWYDNSNLGVPVFSDNQGFFQTDSITITTNYFVTLKDTNGCESNPATIVAEVVNPLAPEIDLLSGLLVHYTFEGNTQDQSGNNINANIIGNNFTYVADRFSNPNSALNLNGSTRLDAGNPPQVGALNNQVTITMWIKQTPSNWGFTTPLLNKWQNNGLFVGLDSYLAAPNQPNENRVRWRVNNGTVVNSNTNVPHNNWHHIVCTYDGTRLRIYQNGVLTGQANHSGTITNTITNLEFGRLANGLGNVFYRGDVDDVRLYNRALSPNEIQALFNNGSIVFSNSPVCEGEDILLSSPNFTGASYSWFGPNNFSSSSQIPDTIKNADSTLNAGIYSLEITRNGCTSPPQNIEVNIKPTPQITDFLNDTVCGISNATLTANSDNADAAIFWYMQAVGGNPINNQSSSELIISNITQNENRYAVASFGGCESNRQEVVAYYYDEVNTNLTLNGSSFVCEDTDYELILSDSELGVIYEVLINNDSSGVKLLGTDSSITFNLPFSLFSVGNNLLTVSASSVGCSPVLINDSIQIEAFNNPNTTIQSNTGYNDLCNGQEITLETSQLGISYLWITGDTTASINVSSAGNFFVNILYQNGCTFQSEIFNVQEINIPKPSINIIGDTSICHGASTVLEVLNAQNILWNNNDTNSIITVSSGGNYYVQSYLESCSVNSDTINIVSYPLPNIDVVASKTSLCLGDSVYLSAQGAGNISWNQNILDGEYFSPSITQTYLATITDSNNCQNADSIIIEVNQLPLVLIDASDTEVCLGDSVTLSVLSNDNIIWNNGVNNGVAFAPTSSNTYFVELVDSIQCANMDSITIIVNQLPSLNIAVSQLEICQGEETTLTAQGQGSLTWSNGVVNGMAFSPNQTNTYTATLIDSNFCQISEAITIKVNPLPNIDITSTSTEICKGDSVLVSVNSNGVISWSNNILNNQYFSPDSSNFYFVNVVDSNSCQSSDSIFIEVFDLPNTSLIFGDSIVNCSSESDFYSVSNNLGSSYFWTVPSGAIINSGQGTNEINVNFNSNFGVISVVETSINNCLGEEKFLNIDCNLSSFRNVTNLINVFPNPTFNNITIDFGKHIDSKILLMIYDNKGKLIINNEILSHETIDLSNLSQGVYYGLVVVENNSFNFRVNKL